MANTAKGPSDSPPAPPWVGDTLRMLGFRAIPETVEVRRLHEGVLSEVYELRTSSGCWIVKLFRLDLREAATRDPDPRFEATARWMSLPPFFSSTRERVEALRDRVPVELPRIEAEGRLPGELCFSAMRPISGRRLPDGEPWPGEPGGALSRQMGTLLRRLHEGGTDVDVPWSDSDEFLEEWAQSWHCLIDVLPDRAGGGLEERSLLHLRLHRLLDSARRCQLGPTVLIHGDFAPSNVLLSPDGTICALLDFQLCCPAPAFMDFRWLHVLDREAFLESYGWPREARPEAAWLGRVSNLFWDAMILVVLGRFATFTVPVVHQIAAAERFRSGLALVEAHSPR